MCKKHEKVDHNITGVKDTLHDQNGGHVKTSVRDVDLGFIMMSDFLRLMFWNKGESSEVP
jgi:hypothetical protein